MDLKEVQISEIKNLNLIYIFTTDNILRGKSEKYIGAKVVFGDNQMLSLDYKDPYFESFIKRIIERYNKEKDTRNIILLGDLTKKIVNDEDFHSLGTIPTQKTVGISIFNTRNYELKKYESYFFDTLKNILKIIKGYEVVDIDKIDGYNNKFVVYYHVGTVDLQMRLLVSFRDKNHIDFRIGHVDGVDLSINGTIENNISNVIISWSSSTTKLSGETKYDSINNFVEKKIVSNKQTIYYSEASETIIQSDIDLVKFYLNIVGIDIPKNMIKTSDYNYILGDEEVISNVDDDLFYKNNGVQVSINKDRVIIRNRILNGLNKYNNQINVTLSDVMSEFILSKLVIEDKNYILVEQKSTNDFGSIYDYKIYKAENFDFIKPFVVEEMVNVNTNVESLYDVKCYIKKKEGEKN